MRHILLVLLGLLVLAACGEETSPNLICTGAVEVDIHITRFGADTTAYCVVGVDTVPLPPEPPDDDCDDDHGHGHGRHHRHGHHDHRGDR